MKLHETSTIPVASRLWGNLVQQTLTIIRPFNGKASFLLGDFEDCQQRLNHLEELQPEEPRRFGWGENGQRVGIRRRSVSWPSWPMFLLLVCDLTEADSRNFGFVGL